MVPLWVVHQLWVLLLRCLLALAVPASALVAVDHLRRSVTFLVIKARQRWTGARPQDRYPCRPLPADLSPPSAFPRVAVQLPIFNERAVCQQLINAACGLRWPSGQLRIQVLDDSTDAKTRKLIDDKVDEWRGRGVAIDVARRTNRQGYKAGALKVGLESLQNDCKYVAIFDADFRPNPDFLLDTVQYLEGSPNASYVQTRWTFANAEESFLTQAQEVSLNYHFKCEQLVHFAEGSFFNFNGTAGVWRVEAIDSVGGWSSRTTVEDMDLSLRTYLAGWQAIYLDDVTSVSELPSSLYAYRKQQHRWTAGPVQLLRKVLPDVWRSQLSPARKAELLLSFFAVGKVATHLLCSLFYCALLPLSVAHPELRIPVWALLHAPVAVTICTVVHTRGGVLFAPTYVLFQNAVGMVKLWAVCAGALGLRGANEWVVTTKLGRGRGGGGGGGGGKPEVQIPSCRVYPGELGMAAALLAAAAGGMCSGVHFGCTLFLLLQGLTFACFGLNMVDCGRKVSYGGGLLPLFSSHGVWDARAKHATLAPIPATAVLHRKG